MAENARVVIVGAGHNGLVAAGYLGRAGLDVQVLERRDIVGGAAVTEEWFPGYKISTCSYVCHILQQKVIDELELRRYGFHVYPIDPSRVHPFPNGKAVTLLARRRQDGRGAAQAVAGGRRRLARMGRILAPRRADSQRLLPRPASLAGRAYGGGSVGRGRKSC